MPSVGHAAKSGISLRKKLTLAIVVEYVRSVTIESIIKVETPFYEPSEKEGLVSRVSPVISIKTENGRNIVYQRYGTQKRETE